MEIVIRAKTGAVKIIHGVNEGVFNGLEGVSVRRVYPDLVDAFNLPQDAIAFVNGVRVGPDYRLVSGDTLEFCKAYGCKERDRLMTLSRIESVYGFTTDLCNQLSGCLIPIAVNSQGESLYLESSIDDWIKYRATGVDRGLLVQSIAADLRRIADRLDPPPSDKIGTPYVADRLDCTTVWITELIRRGEIPANCIVPGTGNGKPWKFYRERIDRWLKDR